MTVRPESRFFPSTARCPHPERWHSTDGDSTELEVTALVAALARALQPDLVVETGAAFGQTTVALACALKENGHGALISLEPDHARYQAARRLLHPYDNALVLPVESLKWTPPGRVGLLFSDSVRDIRADEIEHFWPWMGAGTIVAVHDAPWDVGPWRGWLEAAFVAPGRARAIDLPTPRGLCLLEVLG